MPRELGQALVGILPDLSGFLTKAKTSIEADLKKVDGTVPIKADVRPATQEMSKLQAKVAELVRSRNAITVDVNDKAAVAALARMDVRLDQLGRKVAKPGITVTGELRALADIAAVDDALDKLNGKTAHVTIDAERRGLPGRFGGLLTSGIGGAGGLLGAVPGLGGLAGANPLVAVGAIGAAIASLPFVAQAAGGGIVAALGAGLAALPIIGASKAAGVQAAFRDMSERVGEDLQAIGVSFEPVLEHIAGTVRQTFDKLTPVLSTAAQTISGPFQAFAGTLIRAFGQPAVQKAIQAVATAFADILRAVTPTLAGDIGDIATGITNIAQAISENPNAVADFVSDLFKIAGGALNIISSLTRVANWIESHWDVIKWIVVPVISAVQLVIAHWGELRHETAVIFDGVRHEIAHVWDQIFSNTVGSLIRIGHNIETQFNSIRHEIAVIWDGARHDVAHVWDIIYNNTIGAAIRLGKDLLKTLRGAWDSIVTNVWNPVKNFITQTLPGWFDTAVSTIGRLWNRVMDVVKVPVRFVINTVLGGLAGVFNTITHAIGLGSIKIPVPHVSFARGGYVAGGSGPTADDQLAWVSRGEVIVPAHMVSRGEVDHLRGRLPGFAAGGAAGAPVFQGGGTPVGRPAFGTFVNPIGRGLVPERVDMGVDYGGSGPLFALGSGTITSVYNSGWPGGTFIDLRLQPTLGSGFWFYAENISPLVRLGQAVAAGQLVGRATGGPSGIEVGWASGRGGQTMAAASGQATAGQRRGDPGFFPTAWGVAASNLIASLGGPAGIIRGPVQGGTAGPGFLLPAVLKLISGLARFATMGAGGAGGILKDILLRIPAMLVKAAENWVSKHILAPAGTAGPANADAAQAQAYAKSQLARYGWDMTQWPPLNSLWTHESNWNRLATNAGRPYAPYGVAYGIPQALPAIKMGPLANPPTSSAAAQIDWGLGYIKGRYGSPAAAWAFDVNNGMKGYARGGRVGVLASPMPPPTRAYVRDLERFQARATRDYGGLRRALEHDLVRGGAGTWDWQHRTSIRTGLEKLKRAEFAERAAVYQLLTGHSGINQRTLSAFRKVLAAEEKAAADPDLGSWVTMTEHGRHVRHAHGHPGWASGLRWWLKELGQLTAHMPAAWESPRPGSMPLAPHLSTLAGAYSFDRGNTLPPGYSISYNGLGRPEALVPADSMPAHVTIVVENHGVLGGRAEVGNWLAGEIDRLARQGRLTYALRRSVSAS